VTTLFRVQQTLFIGEKMTGRLPSCAASAALVLTECPIPQ
jgi:hypothetical protein